MLDTPIEYLKSVGPQRADLLKKELSIYTFGDLLYHYPFRHIDRSRFTLINKIHPEDSFVQIRCRVISSEVIGEKAARRLVVRVKDDSGSMDLVFFQGIKWIQDKFKAGSEWVAYGKPSEFKGRFNLVHPEMESPEEAQLNARGLQPVYASTEKLKAKGLDSKGILKLVRILFQLPDLIVPERLPAELLERFRFLPAGRAIHAIHFPTNETELKEATNRIKFEELFLIQLRLLKNKQIRTKEIAGHPFRIVGDYFHQFYQNHLPFNLTEAQKRVIREIRTDMGSGKQMNRLVQGDVGSGKTIVALLCMLIAMDNGYQSCLMAPTEILATQHFENIKSLLKESGISCALLTGSTKKSERTKILDNLKNGELPILIGTHALLEDPVQFKNLGLAVIDEQHRFGVEQRFKLWKKNSPPPHVLVMTATPIPRTLAMTLYGDLDVSVIDELPAGRKPIITQHKFDSHRLAVFGFMKEQIALGRQVYVVYPLIEESEKLDLKDLMDGYESIVRSFPPPEYQVSIVHGKMKSADKELEMQRFLKKETQIMVATTVIEVGVNVPNASVMVIENAERFGLSQLHQLRGRVGRGADQSYCILMSSYKLSAEARERLETMVRTNDGFEIAETDLRLRGPGDIEGTQQSGVLDLKLADLAKDGQLLAAARNYAVELLEKDPELENRDNYGLRIYLLNYNKTRPQWSRIS